MIVVLVAASAVTVVGAIVALSTRDPRSTLAGLAAVVVGSALVDDPLPDLLDRKSTRLNSSH